MKYLFFMLSLMLAIPAIAGKIKQNPIEITANKLEIIQNEQKAIFTGSVHAKQSDIVLSSEKMVVFYREKKDRIGDAPAIKIINAYNNVILSSPTETAKGDVGIYYVDKKTITLAKNVILTRGKNILKGDFLKYNMRTGKSSLSSLKINSENNNGRVKAIFVPQKK